MMQPDGTSIPPWATEKIEQLRADPAYQDDNRKIRAALAELRADGRRHTHEEVRDAFARHGYDPEA